MHSLLPDVDRLQSSLEHIRLWRDPRRPHSGGKSLEAGYNFVQ